MAGCGAPATPGGATAAILSPTGSRQNPLASPTAVGLASSPTPPTTATVGLPLTSPVSSCEPARRWRQSQGGLTLTMCFEPHPPQLGVLTKYEAILVDAAGRPLSEAVVELTLFGSVTAMEGEYDEGFSVTLAQAEAGRYVAEAKVGPASLVLTEVRLAVTDHSQAWTFATPAGELPRP